MYNVRRITLYVKKKNLSLLARIVNFVGDLSYWLLEKVFTRRHHLPNDFVEPSEKIMAETRRAVQIVDEIKILSGFRFETRFQHTISCERDYREIINIYY